MISFSPFIKLFFVNSLKQKHLVLRCSRFFGSLSRIKSLPEETKSRIPAHLMKQMDLMESQLKELKQLETQNNDDKELKQLVANETKQLVQELSQLENEAVQKLIIDEDDFVDEVMLELNAGVGGQEAMLFTKEMFELYLKLCAKMSWSFDVLSLDCDTDSGGARIASLLVSGSQCFASFRHEAGVHRVQRIPKTEKSGRIHTSTVTVAVVPIRSRFNGVKIEAKDLEFEMKTSQGAGGQHVNKTKSCVRVIHVPTGIVVECQEQRSQIINKKVALAKLKIKLDQMEIERRRKEEISTKKAQVGNAARSDKIRTYNFVQDRITDHRLADNMHDMDSFMKGNGEKLIQLIAKLEQQRRHQLIEQIWSQSQS